jgi:hypothetical protein
MHSVGVFELVMPVSFEYLIQHMKMMYGIILNKFHNLIETYNRDYRLDMHFWEM